MMSFRDFKEEISLVLQVKEGNFFLQNTFNKNHICSNLSSFFICFDIHTQVNIGNIQYNILIHTVLEIFLWLDSKTKTLYG